jgi:flavin-dependent dehydrogenase
MTQPDYELLIIGAGPAGSTAAALARQKNHRTLVVEKSAFPRFRIGESLLPAGNAILRETGVWPKIESAGFIRKNGALFYLANGAATQEIDFSTSLIPGLDYTYQVERAKFDALLLDHARSLGAEVWLEAPVRSLATDADRHRVEIETAAGPRTVTARWVLDATGRESSLVTAQKRALDPSPFPKRLAIYSHFRGVRRPAGRMAGATIVVRLEDGWFWIIPIDAERTSVGLVIAASAMRGKNLPPENLFHHEVARSPQLLELMTGATPTMPFHVTSDYSYFRRDLAQERLLLIGDAAGFFDPIFSSGVYMAMSSARMAVELLARAHAAGRALTPAERRGYTRRVKRHAGVFQRLIAAFYDRDSFSVFMSSPVPWDLAPGLASIVAGHARLTWPLWWRFHVFLLVCRLQRHFTITPRIQCESLPHQA